MFSNQEFEWIKAERDKKGHCNDAQDERFFMRLD